MITHSLFHVRGMFAMAVTLVVGLGSAGPDLHAEPPSSERVIRPARERIIEGWLIGGTIGDPARRNVGRHQVGDAGWSGFVDSRARDVYAWGIRRFWLHNPFGTLKDEVMQFDQYLDAREAGLDVLTEDFVQAWRPVVQGRFGEPVEVISYIGVADPDDDRLADTMAHGVPANTLSMMLRCIQPFLEAGTSIGADAATPLSDDGVSFHFYKYLEAIGVPVYVESRPQKANPRWAEFPVFAENHWWHRSNPDRFQDSGRWAMPDAALTREVIRWIRDYPGRATDQAVVDDVIRRTREALLEGHTVILRTDGLRAAGVRFEQLIEGIDEALGVDPQQRDAASEPASGPPSGLASEAEPRSDEKGFVRIEREDTERRGGRRYELRFDRSGELKPVVIRRTSRAAEGGDDE